MNTYAHSNNNHCLHPVNLETVKSDMSLGFGYGWTAAYRIIERERFSPNEPEMIQAVTRLLRILDAHEVDAMEGFNPEDYIDWGNEGDDERIGMNDEDF